MSVIPVSSQRLMGTETLSLHVDPSISRNMFSLNGIWDIQPGPEGVPTAGWTHHVQVPALVDLSVPRYNWRQHEFHWYRKVFKVDASTSPETAFLKIDQAMFGTALWLNGQYVGSDIACYTSQEYDISDALDSVGVNELLVRVGAKSTLPPESAVGKDQERTEFIPGIWGDVNVIFSGNPRIMRVQIIPDIHRQRAEVRITVENRSNAEIPVNVNASLVERQAQRMVFSVTLDDQVLAPHRETLLTLSVHVERMQLWSPETPFLYELVTSISAGGKPTDSVRTCFGMREFKVVGSDFFFNGKRIFLRGGNIAFHRFLSDADRGALPWDPDWIKRVLIDIPKQHNFNFFRNHIGQMYNRWYDIADEHGMLLQNEWQFWTTTGTKEQITKEFTRWLQDNWNHPSIIIWDALNECSDAVVQSEIIPEMKKLDPTRPWESLDFVEQHPYIYSLGPVLNGRRFGFTVPMDELETMATPTVVNEFLWWWLDKEWNPTILMQDVVERWLGKDYTVDELIGRQSFLAQELVELFRRMGCDAIQPFVYLSNNAGPTAHWFTGNIKDLQPKLVLKALKNAFSPFGLSLELWDRHFTSGESRTIRLFVLNDDSTHHTGTVRYGVVRFDGTWTYDTSLKVSVEGTGCWINIIQIVLPRQSGEYRIRAELYAEGFKEMIAWSEKVAHVFDPPGNISSLEGAEIMVLDGSGEIGRFLLSHNLHVHDFSAEHLETAQAIIVGEGMLLGETYANSLPEISRFVRSGGSLVLIEPEYGVEKKEEVPVVDDLSLTLEPRDDADKGGYDSYIFADDLHHSLWAGIEKKHLHMFNGGLGGEVVSQHDVTCPAAHVVHARCGLKLSVKVVMEMPYGQGRVIVSRLQVRGRLMKGTSHDSLFNRRPDPVLQQYFLNLVRYAGASPSLVDRPEDREPS